MIVLRETIQEPLLIVQTLKMSLKASLNFSSKTKETKLMIVMMIELAMKRMMMSCVILLLSLMDTLVLTMKPLLANAHLIQNS